MRRCVCEIPGPLSFIGTLSRRKSRYRSRRSLCSQRARCALSDDLIASTWASQPFELENLKRKLDLPVREAPGRLPAYATLLSAR